MDSMELIIPNHVAIILDGNGRWAKKRGLPRNYGHSQGSKAVEQICEDAYKLGVKYLTVYAFSTENWKRPKEEVEAIMKLLRSYLKTSIKTSEKNNMKVRVLGDKTRLSQDIQDSIKNLEESSKNKSGLNLQVAINYGGRDELVRAIKSLSLHVKDHTIDVNDIDETILGEYIDTKGIPDPDLLIRTSGETRLSNFMLWQMAYTEFYFTDVLWPDFNKVELMKAIEYYSSRTRNYGGISTNK